MTPKQKAQKNWKRRNAADVKRYNDAYRLKHPERVRNNNLHRIGWTIALFDRRMIEQHGRCAICQRVLAELPSKMIHADHCHISEIARGILCHHCNTGLGAFKDDVSRLASAMSYLLKHRPRRN